MGKGKDVERLAQLRQNAEEQIHINKPSPLDEALLADTQKLVQELQVHQVELELQNEELRDAQARLAVERERYADLYNFAPVAYFLLDENDVILSLNYSA